MNKNIHLPKNHAMINKLCTSQKHPIENAGNDDTRPSFLEIPQSHNESIGESYSASWICDKNNYTDDAFFSIFNKLNPICHQSKISHHNSLTNLNPSISFFKTTEILFYLLSFETFFNICHCGCHCHFYSAKYILVFIKVSRRHYIYGHITFSTWAVYILINSIN